LSTRGGSLPLIVLAAALAGVSSGSILIRLAHAEPLAIAAWRLVIASAVVLPAALVVGPRNSPGLRAELLSIGAGVLLALHFATWIASLAYTTVAQSVVLVTTGPVWVAVIGLALRVVPARELSWPGIGLCVAGAAIVAVAPAASGAPAPQPLLGNALALAGAVAIGAYMLVAREAQKSLAFLPFIARSYSTAAVVLTAAVAMTGTPALGFDSRTWLALGALALLPQLVGHGGTNWALRHLSPAFVSVVLVGEPVFASLLAWAILGEPITAAVAAGGTLVLAGILTSARRR
jgi:drug/metabolite transporter (DMT)-like permease